MKALEIALTDYSVAEVVVSEGIEPAYSMECDVCGSERLVTADGERVGHSRE